MLLRDGESRLFVCTLARLELLASMSGNENGREFELIWLLELRTNGSKNIDIDHERLLDN